jgi:hypothetical protein
MMSSKVDFRIAELASMTPHRINEAYRSNKSNIIQELSTIFVQHNYESHPRRCRNGHAANHNRCRKQWGCLASLKNGGQSKRVACRYKGSNQTKSVTIWNVGSNKYECKLKRWFQNMSMHCLPTATNLEYNLMKHTSDLKRHNPANYKSEDATTAACKPKPIQLSCLSSESELNLNSVDQVWCGQS